jgi:peroxiredoxin
MLPVAVRHHQETLGKVQDLYFSITDLKINPGSSYDFGEPPFLAVYKYQVTDLTTKASPSLLGKHVPHFRLESFDGKFITTNDLKGKVVLLDFWEVWCGPCIESMPRVIALYNRYHHKGFEVYGITNDLKQLSFARVFAERKKINFPLLTGNEELKMNYNVEAVPMYVLIDKNGIVRLVSAVDNDLETMIKAWLN